MVTSMPTFDYKINLTTYAGNPSPAYVTSLEIANEPSNDIHQFYVLDTRTADKAAHIDLSNYSVLEWDRPQNSVTKSQVQRIGTKSFPHIGAMSFYKLLSDDRSFILAPVFMEKDRYTRPGFTATQTATQVTFTMTMPEDITYMCWRVIMVCDDTAFEYVTYEDTLTVDNPYISGTYDCYCVGYVGEGQAISDDSAHVYLTIIGSGEDPLDKFDYYTKTDIDGMQPTVLTTTLLANRWVGAAAPYAQTVQLAGITLSGFSYVASPAASDWSNYCKYGIYMNEPAAAGSVTFYAISDLPLEDLTVNILKVGVRS